MYRLLNILVCQGEWEHWKTWASRIASPCYRAVTLRDFKTVQLVIYWFQTSRLTFDFPLQLGFSLHFGTLVSTVQLPGGFLLKAASDIKFQLSCSGVTRPQALYFSSQGYSDATVFRNLLHLDCPPTFLL